MEVAVEETQSFLCYPTPNQTTRESWSGPLENHRFFKIYSVLLISSFLHSKCISTLLKILLYVMLIRSFLKHFLTAAGV